MQPLNDVREVATESHRLAELRHDGARFARRRHVEADALVQRRQDVPLVVIPEWAVAWHFDVGKVGCGGKTTLSMFYELLLLPFEQMGVVKGAVRDGFAGGPRERRVALGAPHLTAPRDALRVDAATGTGLRLLGQQGYGLDVVLVALVVWVVVRRLDFVALGADPRVAHAALALPVEEAAAAVLLAAATRVGFGRWLSGAGAGVIRGGGSGGNIGRLCKGRLRVCERSGNVRL